MGRSRWPAAALVAALAVLPYLQTIRFDFVFDDLHLIVHNAFLRENWSAARAFAHDFWHGTPSGAAYYRPLVVASLALNGRLLGWGPAGFHLVNVLLHAANALLVLALLRRLGCAAPAATFAAALFAVHPAAAWPVASVVARVDLLPALFILLAWLHLAPPAGLAARDQASRSARRGLDAALAGLFFLLALLSKESALAFLVVPILGLRRLREEGQLVRPEVRSGAAGARAALAGAVAVYFLLRRHAGLGFLLGRHLIDPLTNPLGVLPIGARLPAAAALAGRYLLYLFVPLPLRDRTDYLDPAFLSGSLDAATLLLLLLLPVLIAVVGTLWLRRDATSLPLAFALAGFIPASNLIFPIASLYAMNFLYLPLLGTTLAIGIALDRLARDPVRARWPVAAAAVAILATLAMTSWRETRIWRNDVTLFGALVDRFPSYPPAHSGLGVALLNRGEPAAAIAPLRKALGLTGASLEAHYNLGVALILTAADRAGREEALTHLRRAIELRPNLAPAHYQAARVLLMMGRGEEAEAEARETLRIDPGFSPARKALADALVLQGR